MRTLTRHPERGNVPDMSVHAPALTLRSALADDELFLFELRKATMTKHLARVGGNRSRMNVG